MQQLVYTMQADLYGLIILIIIYLNFVKKADMKNTSNRIFLLVLEMNAVAFILDIIMVGLDGVPGTTAHLTLIVTTVLFYIVNPIPCYFWMAYADYFIHRDENRLKKYALPALIPVALNAVAAIISPFTGFLFLVGPDNVYHRGPYFLAMPFFCYLYIFLTTLFIILNRSKIRRGDWVPMIFFAVPPAVAGTLQILYYGVALMWPALTISVLVVFLYIQSNIMDTDHLTGLFNQRQFENYLADWQKGHSGKKTVGGVMLDLDSFKQINDTFGHMAGDMALADFSDILRGTFRRNDFIARIGGDEFVVLFDADGETEVRKMVQRLEENIAVFNAAAARHYHLGASMGYGMFTSSKGLALKEFFDELDSQMYESKRARKMETGN